MSYDFKLDFTISFVDNIQAFEDEMQRLNIKSPTDKKFTKEMIEDLGYLDAEQEARNAGLQSLNDFEDDYYPIHDSDGNPFDDIRLWDAQYHLRVANPNYITRDYNGDPFSPSRLEELEKQSPDNISKDNSADMSSTQKQFKKNVADLSTNIDQENEKTYLEKMSGAKEGTPEYEAYRKMVQHVNETNSTENINNLTKGLHIMGWAGGFTVVVLTFLGVCYDTDFHAPMLHEKMGDFLFWILMIFATYIVMFLGHGMADGLTNNKYKFMSRKIVISLFIFGTVTGFYLEYRAIVNITNDRLGKSVDTMLAKGTTSLSSAPKAVLDMKNELSKDVNTTATAIIKAENKLAELEQDAKELSDKTKTQKYIDSHWRNKNRVLAQIKSVDTKIADKEKKIAELKKKKDEYAEKLLESGEKFSKAMVGLDKMIEENTMHSLVYLFIFAFILKVGSFGHTIASMITNSNIEKADRVNVADIDLINAEARAYKQHVNQLKADALHDMNVGLAINRASLKAINNHGAISGMENVNTLKQTTDTIAQISAGTSELTRMAGEGLGHKVNADYHKSMNNSLQKQLGELSRKIGS